METVFTGFEMIDNAFGGLRPGEVTLIGGRPSMGKTSLALRIALNAARAGKNVLYFTTECSPMALDIRLVSMISGISSSKLREWDLSDDEWEVFKKTIGEVKKLPIRFVQGDSFQTIKFCCSDERKAVTDLIVVDYLQLVHNAYAETKEKTQDHAPLEFLKRFKKIARKQNVPVVVLSQLSRKLERRKDKHPRINDFKIEKLSDADYDQAFLIYRGAYYDLNESRDKAELIGVCPKRKTKEVGTIVWW